MHIIIKAEDDNGGKEVNIALVDDVIENDNFVTLLVADTALHCDLTELLSALTAFQTQRTIRLEVEEKLV